jgi:zinc protease
MPSSRQLLSFLLTLCLAVAAWSEPWVAPSLKYERFTLANGLEVILEKDTHIPYVALSVWYHVGAIQETKGKTGFAHLFEHLMFQGSPHVGKDMHFAYLQGAGAIAVNGTTNFDRTNYFAAVPANELELVLWLESDRMGWLMQSITQEVLDEQRGVVKNERLQRTDNQPYAKAEEKAWQTIFPIDHPYHGLIIGSLKDLDKASLDDVADFFHRYYTPQNATLAIVGDFDEATIRSQIDKYFGSISGVPKPIPATIPKASIEQEIKLYESDPLAKLTQVQMFYLTPPLLSDDDAVFDIIASILTEDKSSRLSKFLLFDRSLVQSVDANQQSLLSTSVFSIEALLQKDTSVDQIVTAIDDQLAALITNPPTQQEIDRAVNQIRTLRIFDLQKIGGNTGRVEQLQTYNHYLGNPDGLAYDLDRYARVTPQKIVECVKTYLSDKKRVLLVVTPQEEESPKGENP